jgi:hypothetical protein
MKRFLFLGMLLLSSASATACEFADIVFSTDFDMARVNGCSQLSERSFLLKITPENRPINHSPWYAFKVNSKAHSNSGLKESQRIEIQIEFDQEHPRYLPKISTNGVNWKNIPFDIVDNRFVFELEVPLQGVIVAGQELFDNQQYDQWLGELAHHKTLESIQLGASTQGRPINAMLSTFSGQTAAKKEWLVLLGRQHPPEVTGALAMVPFTERLLSEQSLAQKFRQRFNLFIVPNLNPDGVANGHWRHNVKGIDLNRDWQKFSQIESRLVRDKLNALVASGGKMIMAIDFHSTQQDVFYTMPTDYGMMPAKMVESWLDLLKGKTASSFVVRNKPGSSPGRGIFKQYFTDTFKVHAITYEMGDNTERKMIQHVANQAADTLMQTLLATHPSEFYLSQEKR